MVGSEGDASGILTFCESCSRPLLPARVAAACAVSPSPSARTAAGPLSRRPSLGSKAIKLMRLTKSGHAQRAGEAGRALGGHDVARAGDVIAKHFEAVFADENSAGVADLPDQGPGVGDEKAKMLGGVVVGQGDRLGQAVGHDDAATVG